MNKRLRGQVVIAFRTNLPCLGNIHVLRKQKGGEGVGQPNAYVYLRGGRGG